MKKILICLAGVASFTFSGLAMAQAAAANKLNPAPVPGVLQQHRPAANAHNDTQANGAYNARHMQTHRSKMASCRVTAMQQGLSGVEYRQSLLNCMK